MLDNILDNVSAELTTIKKNTQKTVIRFYVASQSHATSETRKLVMQGIEKETLEGLKKHSCSFSEKFASAAKGQWVDKAKQTMVDTTQLFDQL
ncbi:hypothetical protein [Listeria grayi]|uniref:hypothetical protein n=1 Tax=Listeria grayi TaxID=1641 RepID=UPI00162ADC81|nr:hypothetical protein [Listeria grayi]MBC1923031.1 hypothetical protein [Listeria grayi]